MTDSPAARTGPAVVAAVVEALPEGIVVLDSGLRTCYLNPAAARLLNRPVERLVGRPLAEALTDAPEQALAFVQRARSARTPVTWRGRWTTTGPELSATATPAAGLLQITLCPGGIPVDRPPVANAEAERPGLRFLTEVAEAMTASLDLERACARLAELVVPRLCDWAVAVVTGEDGQPDVEGRAHRDPARRPDVEAYRDGRLRVSTPDNPMVTALQTGRPVQLNPLDEARIAPTLTSAAVRAAWRRLDTRSAAIVPLRARGTTFGALAMMNAGARPAHTPAEVATASEVARLASVSLDNARLYGQQQKIAETLQRSLLTPPTRTDPDHLHIAVRYRPAASHQAVGGDWYDSFPQADGATVLVLGDVAGHSVEAAAAMSEIRSMLRALATDRPGSPAETLTRLDQAMGRLQVQSLATVVLARVEQSAHDAVRGRRTLRWSSAGHPPPLLLCADGRVRLLDTRPERLLGTYWTGRRTDHTAPLLPGDTVLLVTDGLVEQGRVDIDRGTQRLTAAASGLAGVPLEELCDQLLDRIVAGRPDDDIALLALRCHPEGTGSHR